MKEKLWITLFAATAGAGILAVALCVLQVDPFFHFHRPDTAAYYYELNSERYQNDGISRYFDYDALITGTSMSENFRTT